MLPKKGRKLPAWEGALASRQAYAEVIANLLRKEHGDTHRAVKQLMRLTHASERSAKHWMAAQHGPDTVFFLRLVATSPVIRAFVLGIIESQQSSSAEASKIGPGITSFGQGHREEMSAGRYWPNSDTINDPESGPVNDPITSGLNERQRWILDRVARGLSTRARDVAAHWRVSIKSARRDLAGLCACNLLHFVGARKNGRYHLVRA
ncbi:MAG: hypothetical protein IPF48_14060 [Sphingomonadales bacterium]|jgi:hypothetical protein|uniref:hypothetical protein n=1 Tax=unclassified Blastomonas TaxID=2626550 RepID=UPI00082990BA|nr:hypothetical protein [Blastomonas sp.]MBK6298963.1 hypothetical protein [Sphingomonadales bacterium]MCH2240121.1 hypothetical protein [Blastomonas sp.]